MDAAGVERSLLEALRIVREARAKEEALQCAADAARER
jgi:hypothetical protein